MKTAEKKHQLTRHWTVPRRAAPNEGYEYESERRRMRRLLTEFFDEWTKRHPNSETLS